MSAAAAPPVSPRLRRLGLLALATAGGAVVVAAPLYKWEHRHAEGTSASALAPVRINIRPVVSAAGLAQVSGVRLERVALSGGGGLIDVRYRVIDADKAQAVHAPENPPLVLDQRSGAIVNQLLMSHLHHGRAKEGVRYYLIFYNPGDVIRRGGRVSIQLGGARVEGVTVR